jgi:hypothetical protein
MQPLDPKAPTVRRRRVHYFGGYDPRGSRFYHRLMQEQAEKPQPQGGVYQIGPRKRLPQYSGRWHATYQPELNAPVEVETEVQFMGWDDIIKDSWTKGFFSLIRAFFQMYAGMFSIGINRGTRAHRPLAIAALYPLVFVCLSVLMTLLVGGSGHLLVSFLGSDWSSVSLTAALAAWWSAICWGSWQLGRTFADKWGILWALRTCHFVVRMGKGSIPKLQQRQQAWAAQILASQQADPVDEVILVSHSVGTIVMQEAVAMLLDNPHWQHLHPKPIGALTLGQLLPFVTLAKPADGFRALMNRLCHEPRLRWWDVSTIVDPICFHNVHPLNDTGIPYKNAANPTIHAARFFKMYTPEHWKAAKASPLDAHFLYFKTPDLPGNFHLPTVLFGPLPFEQCLANWRQVT